MCEWSLTHVARIWTLWLCMHWRTFRLFCHLNDLLQKSQKYGISQLRVHRCQGTQILEWFLTDITSEWMLSTICMQMYLQCTLVCDWPFTQNKNMNALNYVCILLQSSTTWIISYTSQKYETFWLHVHRCFFKIPCSLTDFLHAPHWNRHYLLWAHRCHLKAPNSINQRVYMIPHYPNMWMTSYTHITWKWTFPLWMHTCTFKEKSTMNDFLHTSQKYGCSQLWVLRHTFR